MKLIRKILFPIVPIYYLATWVRNKLFDFGLKKSISYNFPVVCVGNLSTGGTGKTPMIEYLIGLLKNNYRVATLSRGYKRKSKGFQLGNKNTTVAVLGDEPFQLYSKFKDDIVVAVDADRNHGIATLRKLEHYPEVVLLDDAFQHRKVKAGFNILLTTYDNLYTEDMVLPTGNLREPRDGAQRAQVIIVTKCPSNLSEGDKIRVISKINPTENQNVFFSSIAYSNSVENENSSLKLEDLPQFTLITGIANPKPLVGFLNKKQLKFEHLIFNDHHEFSKQDISCFDKKACLVTTEKDFMRLKQYSNLKEKVFYLPIKVVIDNDLKFNALIQDFVKKIK